jgi:hypothetical protein
MPIIPAFQRLIQEDHEFEVSLGYIARCYLKTKQNNSVVFLNITGIVRYEISISSMFYVSF